MSIRAACIPDFGGVFFKETVAMHHLLNQDQKSFLGFFFASLY